MKVKQSLRVVLVEPKYQLNLGYIARVMKNFGVYSLYIVNPRCKIDGKKAVQYAKHGRDVLEGAIVVKSLDKAVSGITLGTTGVWRKSDGAFHKIVQLDALRDAGLRNRNVTLVIGRDDSGLNRNEIAACDAVLFIAADERYPVLNISHALAVMLYELTIAPKYNFSKYLAGDDSISALKRLFAKRIKNDDYVRDKKAVSAAFAKVLNRSAPTVEEVNALMAAFSARAVIANKKERKGKD